MEESEDRRQKAGVRRIYLKINIVKVSFRLVRNRPLFFRRIPDALRLQTL